MKRFSIIAGLLLVLGTAGYAWATRGLDSSGGFIYTDTRSVLIDQSADDDLSAEFDLEDYSVVGILMPSAWTAADVRWQCSNTSGGTFYDVYDSAGTQVAWTVAASRFVQPTTPLSGCRWAKLQTSAGQAADRTLILVIAR